MASTGKPAFKQTAFSGGEIAPEAQGRTDVARLASSVNTCENWIPLVAGGAITRPGTEYIAASVAGARLIPWVFSEDQSYVIEVRPVQAGDKVGRMRFYRDGAVIDDPDDPGNPLQASHSFNTAAQIDKITFEQLNDVMWMTSQGMQVVELRRYADDDWRTATYDLSRNIQPPTAVAFDGGGAAWPAATATYPESHRSWMVTSIDAAGNESLPSAALEVTDAVLYPGYGVSFSGSFHWRTLTWSAPATGNAPVGYNIYQGTYPNGPFGWIGWTDDISTRLFDLEPVAPDFGNGPPSGRDPFVVAAEIEQGDEVETAFGSIVGTGAAIGDTVVATKDTAAEAFGDKYTFRFATSQSLRATMSYQLQTDDGIGGGWITAKEVTYRLPENDGIVWHNEVVIVNGLTASAEFRVRVNSLGFSPTDLLYDADDVSWNEETAAGEDRISYPNAVALFEQRLCFGGFTQNPSQLQASRTGSLRDFDVSSPNQDSDALDFLLASKKLNEVRAMLSLDALMVFTAGAEWIVRGAEGGAWTPTSFDFKPRSHNGSSWCEPVLAGSSALIVAPRSSAIREIRYDKEVNVSSDRNLTLLSEHLLRNYSLLHASYAEAPFNLVSWVRDDGTLVTLTYLKEMEIWGFSRQTTDGKFKSVVSIPEDETESKHIRSDLDAAVKPTTAIVEDQRTTLMDATYVIVERVINSVTVYYIERFANRFAPDDKDLICADSALVFDGRGNVAATVTATTGTVWTTGAVITLTSDTSDTFFVGDVGSKYELTDAAGVAARFTITGYTSSTEVATTADQDVQAELQAVGTLIHGLAVNAVSGLTHLEGETVKVVVDGAVDTDQTVSSGAITTDTYGVRIQVGLEFIPELESLNISPPQDTGAARIMHKVISKIGLEVDDWRGLQVGTDVLNLKDVAQRDVEDGWEAIAPENALVTVLPPKRWEKTKRVTIRQAEPLPCTLLSIIGEVSTDG